MERKRQVIKSKQELKFYKEYEECVRDLIQNEDVQSMKKYIQHGDVSCFEHCNSVSYRSYLICRRLGLDYEYRSAARGGMLHDFFLYDWHISKPKRGLHGFTHPSTALENAIERFTLNEMEKDIIEKHMWPLTIHLPKYKESFIVVLVDKHCSLVEIIKSRLKKYRFKKPTKPTISSIRID